MNKTFEQHGKQQHRERHESDPLVTAEIESSSRERRFRLLHWLMGSICIFAVLYGTSYLALLWLPPYEGVDMRSQLTADYGPWAFLVFQPVDASVIEEIRQERGLPEKIIIDGSSWPTAAGSNATPGPADQTLVSTTLATLAVFPSSPTAFGPFYTSTPIPTTTISQPEPTATLNAIETAVPTNIVNPVKTSRPRKTPKPEKTSKPPREPKN